MIKTRLAKFFKYLFPTLTIYPCSLNAESGSEMMPVPVTAHQIIPINSHETAREWFEKTLAKMPMIVIGEQDEEIKMEKNTDYFEDPAGNIVLDDIINDKEEKIKWISHRTDKIPAFGYTDSAFWFRYAIENQSRTRQHFFLELADPYLNYVDLHIIDQDGNDIVTKTGDLYPYSHRPVDHHNFVFPLEIEKNEKVIVLLYSKSATSMLFPLTIWDPDRFHSIKSRELTVFGIYYGMILVMVFYNLFLFISIRDYAYVFYFIYAIAYLVFQASINGLAFKHLWPNNTYLANFGVLITLSFIDSCLGIFTQIFLQTRKRHPVLHHFISIVCYPWSAIGFILSIFGLYLKNTTLINAVFQPLIASTLIITGICSLVKGYRPARFYVLAFSALLLGAMLLALKFIGILPSNVLTEYGSQFGSAAEIVLLSLALGDKIRIEQKLAQDNIERLNTSLEIKVEEIKELNSGLEKKVDEKTRDIKSMLKNIKQGIFTVHLENTPDAIFIDPDFSKHLTDILETSELDGKPLMKSVFDNTSITRDQASMIHNILLSCIGDRAFVYDLNSEKLPTEFEKYFKDGSTKTIEIDWCPVIDKKTEIVEKVLVTLRDVTTIRGLQKKANDQQEELGYISELIDVSEENFAEFMQICRQFIDENRRLVESSTTRDNEALKILFINMHTLKGTARMYGFVKMTSIIHDTEQYYTLLQRDEKEEWDRERLLEDLRKTEAIIQKYIDVNANKLGRCATRNKVYVERSFIENKVKSIKSFVTQPLPEEMQKFINDLGLDLNNIIHKKSGELFKEIFRNINTLARDLKKENPKVEVMCENLSITEYGAELLRNIFVHIIRNSMDHGIESAEERISKGKDPAGKIWINVDAKNNEKVIISYRDDGRGINMEKLREIAKKMQLIGGEALDDRLKVANLIFLEGVSTSKSLTELSGRGVGMNAIRKYLEKSGGEVKLKLDDSSKDDSFVSFELEMSAPYEVLVA
ncbi:MAG: Hpt domain-containing protein [Oligoflexales bacterium]|nr:Hpt domain-containing protein [Oligoflexales bacterium]